MPLRKDSLSASAGSLKDNAGKAKAIKAVAGVGVVLVGAIGFMVWKKHQDANVFHPAPMTVNTVSRPDRHHGAYAGGAIQRGPSPDAMAQATPPVTQALVGQPPSGFVNATPPAGGSVMVTPTGVPAVAQSAIPAPVVAVAPAVPQGPAMSRESMLQQNQSYYLQSEGMSRQISLLKLQLQMKELEDKINGDSSGSGASLPPPPSIAPAPMVGNGRPGAANLAQSISLPLPVANQVPADEVISVADGGGGAAAIVRVGGLQYTVRVGEWVGSMKVVSITHHEVVLAGAGGARKVLTVGS